ncbi:hypothetical protein CBF34_00790 [Vagococcus penaei]|uniref:Uncharacterized protein n=1 Tax=Vagococcus penaei TaxID=633807 RepID=A0A1Q2D5E7_9ENTE|nr:GNAT family protein [Vagococcus penaei]AQP53632.1 hypothetical protein BW732_04870 [Vagococcus penaei]RSU07577.1 hypothetical protein CBF34_00790 [Vagococcus penaei]
MTNQEYTIILREAVPSDAQEVLTLVTELNQETPYLLVNRQALTLTKEDMATEIEQIYHLPNQLILLALDNNRPIGIATVTTDSDPAISHIGEIGISIKQDFWGIGLGTAMITELIDWVEHYQKIKRLEIKVQNRNQRAIALYQKLGFETEGTIRAGIKIEHDEFCDVLLMSRLF